MNNKPNMYRVTYQVMEGDNYAGGWSDRIEDCKTLGEASQYRRIKSVKPIFIEIGDDVPDSVISKAREDEKRRVDIKRGKDEVLSAEARLRTAREVLNNLEGE